jgi:hypothetical protein
MFCSAILSEKNLERKCSFQNIIHNNFTWKMQTRFDWVCTWVIMKRYNTPHAPWHRLESSAIINKSTRQPFTDATPHLTHAVVVYKNLEKVIPRNHEPRQKYMKTIDLFWFNLYMSKSNRKKIVETQYLQ